MERPGRLVEGLDRLWILDIGYWIGFWIFGYLDRLGHPLFIKEIGL
jgi:hypothetical protein